MTKTDSQSKARLYSISLFLVGVLIAGCTNQSNVGKYVNMSDENKYVELASSGKFFTESTAGKYSIDGITVIFEGPNGFTQRGKLVAGPGIKIDREGSNPLLTEGVYSKFLADQIKNNVPQNKRAHQNPS